MTYEDIEKTIQSEGNVLLPYGIQNVAGLVYQVYYWRDHLDVFIDEYFKVHLKDTQQVLARAVGRDDVLNVVQSRGYGKTW